MAGISGFKCPCLRPLSSSLSYSSSRFPPPQLRISRRLSTFSSLPFCLSTRLAEFRVCFVNIWGFSFVLLIAGIYALTSNDIKVGLNIEVDGNPWKVIEFLHVKPGKGAAFVRTTLRNYVTGNQVEKTFRAGSKIEEADISKEVKQYTYKDGAQYVFMDLTSYEESRLNEADVGDKAKWLKEGMDCNLLFWDGKVIDFELPITVKLIVTEVDPGLKGDTAQGGSKPATVETGAVVSVPLFVNTGDTILLRHQNWTVHEPCIACFDHFWEASMFLASGFFFLVEFE